MCSTSSTGDVLQQINQFWSMLDELSQNDPAAYRMFIDKQMKEGAEFSAPPELDTCLCTEILMFCGIFTGSIKEKSEKETSRHKFNVFKYLVMITQQSSPNFFQFTIVEDCKATEPKKGSLYINICSWRRVPAPQHPSRPLPVCAGKPETDTDEGLYTVLDVALNYTVLQECMKDKTELYLLALSCAQQQLGMTLSQQYTVVSCSPRSSPDDLHRRLGFRQWPNTSTQPDTASQTPAALLQQISSLRSQKQHEEPAAQIICRPAEHKKKDLIQVISTTFVQPQKPEYQLEVKTDTEGVARSMELTVELPKVCSMSECQLRISKDDVLVEVEDVYYLLLEFPKTVIEDTASAIFNKKKRTLTLRVDVF